MSPGPIRFDEYQERALYDPVDGFFARGRGAGRRRGDFITSPEVGPLFGAVVARAIDGWWRRSGRPDRWRVVEVGAGRGALAASVLAAAPECGTTMRYVCVERSAVLRDEARDLLGGRVEIAAELPREPADGVMLANELLDNLPVRVLERTVEGWLELHVDDGAEVLAPTELSLEVDVPPGTRLPVHLAAADWARAAVASLRSGVVVAIDYGVERTQELAARPWLRTYRGHDLGHDPLADPGERDITVDVAFDQLPALTSLMTQADFLRDWGIEALVEEGRRMWADRAHVGDLEAVRARSRVTEAEALLDPSGLGAFLVAQWEVGAPALS
ncbi:MAG TPA: SAM-dependent methyltransferase [Microthrixaceae bacterium]|nr:SAM-dependent methyltransferase [Microthrixaceae bacterium]